MDSVYTKIKKRRGDFFDEALVFMTCGLPDGTTALGTDIIFPACRTVSTRTPTPVSPGIVGRGRS
jgi:hypothetical protein